MSARDDDAVYQWSFHHGDRMVARVVKAEIDEAAKRVKFMEKTETTNDCALALPPIPVKGVVVISGG